MAQRERRIAAPLSPTTSPKTPEGVRVFDDLLIGVEPLALLGKHYPICAVLQTWEQREMLSSYLLLRSSVGWGLLELEP